jgi:quercetin dioxygenase-like cupin family protein
MDIKDEKICKSLLEMKYVKKGWGYELWIENNSLYCGKKLHFDIGKKCSVHAHKLKTETFFVNQGELEVYYLDSKYLHVDFDDIFDGYTPNPEIAENILNNGLWQTVVLKEGERFFVPPHMFHRMKGIENSDMFEFSTTHYDSDSYRLLKGD